MPILFAVNTTALTRTPRALRGKRFLAILAIIITSVVSGGKNVEAYTNPFAVGDIDSVTCDSGAPTLNIAISNHGPLPSSMYPGWNNQTLYVASSNSNGSFSTNSAKIPNIAAGSEATINVRVDQAKPNYTIAIHATDSAGNTIKLLTGTVIKPANFCGATINDFVNVPPTNLHVASDQKCKTATLPGVLAQTVTACVDGQDPGLPLAFDYKYPGSVDGYRLYRVDANQHTYIASLKSTQMSYTVAQPKTGDFAGFCYAVVAVKLSTESKPSQTYCAKSTDSIHHDTVTPDYAITYCYYSEAGNHSLLKGGWAATGIFNIQDPAEDCNYYYAQNPVGPPYRLGYLYDINRGIQDSREDLFERFGAHFNLTKYAGHKVVSAVYQLDVKMSYVDFQPYTSGGCAQEAAPAASDWLAGGHWSSLNNADFSNANKFDGLVSGKAYSSSMTQTVDITRFVQPWIDQPNVNHGLIVRNQDENPIAFESNRSCWSILSGSGKLHLTYR